MDNLILTIAVLKSGIVNAPESFSRKFLETILRLIEKSECGKTEACVKLEAVYAHMPSIDTAAIKGHMKKMCTDALGEFGKLSFEDNSNDKCDLKNVFLTIHFKPLP